MNGASRARKWIWEHRDGVVWSTEAPSRRPHAAEPAIPPPDAPRERARNRDTHEIGLTPDIVAIANWAQSRPKVCRGPTAPHESPNLLQRSCPLGPKCHDHPPAISNPAPTRSLLAGSLAIVQAHSSLDKAVC